MLHLKNPCVKRKVLSLTKPKGNIYKTKSLGNYITILHLYLQYLVELFLTVVWFQVFLYNTYNLHAVICNLGDWCSGIHRLQLLLCFDLLTRPKMPFKVVHRKEVTHPGRWKSEEVAQALRRVYITVWEFEDNIRPTN